jgi:MraZ protein
MSEAFKSHYTQKVDGKARVSIPAAFRRVLEAGDPNYSTTSRPRVAIVYGGDDRAWLECYTISGMRRMERRIGRMPPGDKKRIYLAENVITLSQEVEIDDEGRIVLPQPAREKIGINSLKDGAEAVFAGTLDTFRIWHRDDWEANRARQKAIAETLLAPGEDMLSLLPDDDEPEE